jgi:hypothetical protein
MLAAACAGGPVWAVEGLHSALMRSAVRITSPLIGALGVALVAVGFVYLIVECQALPGFLGPTRGDTSPRTGLGIAALLLGLIAFAVAVLTARRRPPRAPNHP